MRAMVASARAPRRLGTCPPLERGTACYLRGRRCRRESRGEANHREGRLTTDPRWQAGKGTVMSKDAPLTPEELAGEGVTALPDKEVVSILDLAADVDLAIDGAAPIDLAVALNANVVAPIDAAVSANLLSDGSTSQALSDQGVQVTQTIEADAIATGIQDSTIDQSDTIEGTAPVSGDTSGDAMLSAATAT